MIQACSDHFFQPAGKMKTHRIWTTATLCWFFTLFNIERIIPAVNLASFVYALAALAGASMLATPTLRRQPFGLTAACFGMMWIVGKCLLGYSVDFTVLPIALVEVVSIIFSQYLCLKVAQNTDEFEIISSQLLDVLRAHSVSGILESEPLLQEEIRRARRHERPLSFVWLKPGEITSSALSDLVRQLERRLSREYLTGCISRILEQQTKSQDLAVRVGDQFLILLPETSAGQAQATAQRLQAAIESQLGIPTEFSTCAFGVDVLTLSSVLERMENQTVESSTPRNSEIFEISPRMSRPSASLAHADSGWR